MMLFVISMPSARKQMSGEYNVKRDPIPGPGHLQPAAEEGGGDPWTPFQLDSPETGIPLFIRGLNRFSLSEGGGRGVRSDSILLDTP